MNCYTRLNVWGSKNKKITTCRYFLKMLIKYLSLLFLSKPYTLFNPLIPFNMMSNTLPGFVDFLYLVLLHLSGVKAKPYSPHLSFLGLKTINTLGFSQKSFIWLVISYIYKGCKLCLYPFSLIFPGLLVYTLDSLC